MAFILINHKSYAEHERLAHADHGLRISFGSEPWSVRRLLRG